MKLSPRQQLCFLLVAALWVRLIGLSQSLWLDEAITAQVIQNHSLLGLVREFSPLDFHPPLHYLLLKIWGSFFGFSEVALRSTSVILSLLAGYLVYQTGKHLKDQTTGWWSAAFFLFNPLIVYYSQEARMYMLVTCLVAANFFLLQRVLSKNSSKTEWLLFGLTIVLSLLSFYGVIFYLGALGVYLIWRKKWPVLAVTAASGATGVLIVFPLLSQQFTHSQVARQIVPNWTSVLGTVTLKNFLLIPLKLLSGRLSFFPKFAYYALSGGWTMVVGVKLFVALRKHIWLATFLIAPLLLGVGFSIFTPLLQYFRFLYLAIFVALALGLGVSQRWARRLLLAGFAAWSLVSVVLPQFHREDWKSLAQQVESTHLPVYMIVSSSDPLHYYAPQIVPRELRDLAHSTIDTVVVIPYTADVHGIDLAALQQRTGFTVESESTVRNLSWQVWRKTGSQDTR